MESRNPQARSVGARNGHQWCHMYADTPEELDRLAAAIGLRLAWVQDHTWLRHYDLTPSKRVLALANGAVDDSKLERLMQMKRTHQLV